MPCGAVVARHALVLALTAVVGVGREVGAIGFQRAAGRETGGASAIRRGNNDVRLHGIGAAASVDGWNARIQRRRRVAYGAIVHADVDQASVAWRSAVGAAARDCGSRSEPQTEADPPQSPPPGRHTSPHGRLIRKGRVITIAWYNYSSVASTVAILWPDVARDCVADPLTPQGARVTFAALTAPWRP